jgi:ABC-type multidrug transport system permease subunit
MAKFYEIRLLTAAGFVSLIVISIIAYIGGRILPLGLGIIPIPFIIELIISIYYIKLSIENKKIHFLCFSVIIIIIAFIAGVSVDNYETQKTKNYLINIGNTIEEYKFNHNLKYLSENDIINLDLPDNIHIDNNGNEYILRYKDGIYNSETKEVNFRPRP